MCYTLYHQEREVDFFFFICLFCPAVPSSFYQVLLLDYMFCANCHFVFQFGYLIFELIVGFANISLF